MPHALENATLAPGHDFRRDGNVITLPGRVISVDELGAYFANLPAGTFDSDLGGNATGDDLGMQSAGAHVAEEDALARPAG